nr:hypothetical protein GCM10020241_12660 [Streptoalloteichus tenebrarius]
MPCQTPTPGGTNLGEPADNTDHRLLASRTHVAIRRGVMTSTEGGFAGAAAMMSGLRQQYDGLRASVDAGGFRVEPEAAANAAKACRDYISKLDSVLSDARHLTTVTGLGDCQIGNALANKFAKKADGGQNSLIPIVRQAQEILEKMAQTYEEAGRSYRGAEDSNRQAFGGHAG